MVKTTHQYLLLLLWLIFVFGDFILTAEPLPPKMWSEEDIFLHRLAIAGCVVRGWPQEMRWTHISQTCCKVAMNQKKGLNRANGNWFWRFSSLRFEFILQQLMTKLFPVNITVLGSLRSLPGSYAINKHLSFLRFFSVRKDAPVRLPAPILTSPVGWGAAEGLQTDAHLAPAVLSLG